MKNENISKKNKEILKIINEITNEFGYLFYMYKDVLPYKNFDDLMDKLYKLKEKIEKS